ncbi:hypothetical protein K8O68_03120 [Salipaludibacillus sp. CUR1]|uniref:hypothetical protein n=1 Tax=Salipaludibacillus sp. CUR1 TaxID=2820003 RepID=UPI001E2C8A9A|nr:hypothetical protein [Salipaludibacillus sp. CUR1]MCE7791414.1 hypothetical protein [Salipaludibacillus sp. CUR1]
MRFKKSSAILCVCLLYLLNGCTLSNYNVNTPIEFTKFSKPHYTAEEKEDLVAFIYEAEAHIQKPVKEAVLNEDGVPVFPDEFKSKNDLFEYFQAVLSIELADTMARKLSDLSLSKDGEYLAAVIDAKYPTIEDATENTISLIQHTTVHSVVEMEVMEGKIPYRLQYTIMKNRFGEHKKIVQKTYVEY